jgi:hypothetical protein
MVVGFWRGIAVALCGLASSVGVGVGVGGWGNALRLQFARARLARVY